LHKNTSKTFFAKIQKICKKQELRQINDAVPVFVLL